ncbi:MAG: hypothetical protein IBJ15_14900 [Alphaproteobacteria bacterium]|nr:hypothetical protein [Alphaproteobacteria bacterium]
MTETDQLRVVCIQFVSIHAQSACLASRLIASHSPKGGASSPAFAPGHDPAVMERKMLAFVSMVSMVAALGALAWALGRSSESLIATHPAVMAAAAHR